MNSIRIVLRRAMTFSAVLALAALVAACSSSTSSGEDGGTGGGTIAVTDGVVELSAADLAFDANVIQATAGEAFTISFANNDTAPHNVAIYTEEGGEEIVKGEVIDGGATIEIEVPAQEAGEYYFVCDVHPDMNGSLVVEG